MNQNTPNHNDQLRHWKYGSRDLQLGRFPLIMGIVNVTPDSFSDGGQFLDTNTAVAHALKLVEQGADILDIGGESSRPGAQTVSLADELQRVIPVIEQLSQKTTVPISIDTTKSEVARSALAAGAEIVNDISGLTFDHDMVALCNDSDCGVICMHMQGTPQTMQDSPQYEDVVSEISDYLNQRVEDLTSSGIAAERIVLDPGIGFGKTAEHNIQILSNIAQFRQQGRPVLIGHSQKRFLAKVIGRPIDERTFGTLGISISLAMQSTDIIRVHDVQATHDALTAWSTIISRLSTQDNQDYI